jgi:hypothetical protein
VGDKAIEREDLRSEDIDLVEAVVSPGSKRHAHVEASAYAPCRKAVPFCY